MLEPKAIKLGLEAEARPEGRGQSQCYEAEAKKFGLEANISAETQHCSAGGEHSTLLQWLGIRVPT